MAIASTPIVENFDTTKNEIAICTTNDFKGFAVLKIRGNIIALCSIFTRKFSRRDRLSVLRGNVNYPTLTLSGRERASSFTGNSVQ
jgi:hypothetical protein